MDNEDYKFMCGIIDKMSLPELLSQKKDLKEAQNDPFPDDDQAGDIAVNLWADRVDNRIEKIIRRRENNNGQSKF